MKKTLAILVVLVLALSFTACGLLDLDTLMIGLVLVAFELAMEEGDTGQLANLTTYDVAEWESILDGVSFPSYSISDPTITVDGSTATVNANVNGQVIYGEHDAEPFAHDVEIELERIAGEWLIVPYCALYHP